MTARIVLLLWALGTINPCFAQRAVFYAQNANIGSNNTATAFTYVASSVTGCVNPISATKCAYNLHVNPTAGNLGWVMVEWESNTATPTFSCTNNTTWTAIGSSQVGSGTNAGFRGQMFYIASLAAGASPENCVLTINATVNFMMWEYVEYSYTGSIVSTDGTPQYNNNKASGGTATISGVTTSGSSDIVIGACIGVTSTCTVGAGYTARNDTNGCQEGTSGNCSGGSTGINVNSVAGSLVEVKVNVAAGAQTATFGAGTTDDMILGLVAF